MRRSVFVGALLVFVAGFGFAADANLVERMFRAAQDLERDSQVDSARDAYRQLLEADPAGPRAADATLALARLAWPVSSADELGRRGLDDKALGAALQSLDAVVRKFPSSAAAPEALWRLALLRLEPGGSLYDREQGLAALTTLLRVHPASPRTPAALDLAARVHLEAGRTARARGLAFQALADWPADSRAARAWLTLAVAEARGGRLADALVAAGRARVVAAARDERTAREALGLATALDRVSFGAARGARPFEIEPGRSLGLDAKAGEMTVAPDGALLVLQPAEKLLLSYPAGAGGPAKTPAPNITTLAVDQWGRLWTASGATVTGPPGVGVVKTPERTEVVALAPADARAVWVADARGRRVVRIDALAGVTATAALPERADPIALAADGEGGVWVIDSRDGALVAVSPDGAVRVSAPLEAVARDPVDLDVDAAGFVYVLDAAAPGVLVFGPDGKLLVRQPLQREGENGLPRPALLAVARDGGVAIHDAKLRTIRWLR